MVESELDAFALCSIAREILFSVAIGSNSKTPDIVTDYWAKRRNLYICHDNDGGGARMLEKWTKLFPHAQPFPVPFGKDIGGAVQMGLNVRKWLHEGGIARA
ncbi:MAG: hypothetical protein K940chlam9_00830 [Chlamydiae bacterium]|nr:hypothetical protein [Chlamydiota bacterium]